MRTCHLSIIGKVQGVFFRASAKDIADSLGLCGWVRNTNDGNVEVYAAGDADAIDRFINWCHEGPAGARVDEVLEIPATTMETQPTFRIIR